jgi:hypothetical protein
MGRSKVCLAAILAGSLFCGGYVFGQAGDTSTEQQSPNEKAFIDYSLAEALMSTNVALSDLKPDKDKIAAANASVDRVTNMLVGASQDPVMVRALVRKSLFDFQSGKSDAKSAAQVSQVADEAALRLSMLQVAQNQRIIELLQEVARRDAGSKK